MSQKHFYQLAPQHLNSKKMEKNFKLLITIILCLIILLNNDVNFLIVLHYFTNLVINGELLIHFRCLLTICALLFTVVVILFAYRKFSKNDERKEEMRTTAAENHSSPTVVELEVQNTSAIPPRILGAAPKQAW